MKIATYEAVVENGQIKLAAPVHLPEQTKVFVIVPAPDPHTIPRIASPRLLHPEQATDFVKEVTEEPDDARV